MTCRCWRISRKPAASSSASSRATARRPVAVFYTKDLEYLYRYTEFSAIYHKDRLAAAMQVARPGETKDQAWARFMRDWRALQVDSPFFRLWGAAAIDEMLSALHERIVVGSVV